MFGKKVLGAVIGGILLLGVCNASSPMDNFKDENSASLFAKKINSGSLETTKAVDAIKGIKVTPEIQVNINLVKNLFVASENISNCMVDVQQALLAKQLEIAQGTKLDGLESVSNNLKIIALLMYSQIEQKPVLNEKVGEKSSGTTQISESQQISRQYPKLIKKANTEIVEAVVNRLSSAVNGDKSAAKRLLSEFYDILDDSALSVYVPIKR